MPAIETVKYSSHAALADNAVCLQQRDPRRLKSFGSSAMENIENSHSHTDLRLRTIKMGTYPRVYASSWHETGSLLDPRSSLLPRRPPCWAVGVTMGRIRFWRHSLRPELPAPAAAYSRLSSLLPTHCQGSGSCTTLNGCLININIYS